MENSKLEWILHLGMNAAEGNVHATLFPYFNKFFIKCLTHVPFETSVVNLIGDYNSVSREVTYDDANCETLINIHLNQLNWSLLSKKSTEDRIRLSLFVPLLHIPTQERSILRLSKVSEITKRHN
jgi:hypothetical protein